ncbi:protein peste-like isoform X2 [Lycorma delicatula]
MHMDFYFFNWTNPNEILTEKPSFVELGPYRYIERRKKFNIVFNKNGTISYRIMRTWNFSPKESSGTEEDLVTTVNGIAVAGAYKVLKKGIFSQKFLSVAFSVTKQDLAVTHSIKELLFEGYSDTLMTVGQSMPGQNSSPYDKFGWFYGKNNSHSDGIFNIISGEKNPQEVGVLKQWNYSNRTKFFSEKCSGVYGSSGDLFPRGLAREDTISFFSADVCRTLTLLYAKDDEVRGIPVYRYEVDPDLLDNGTKVAGNECYCNGECVPSGLLNVTKCRYGVPAFMSFPHFLNADPIYTNQIDGMKPDPKKHTFYMSVEPNMGFPLEGAARIQVNLLIRPLEYVSLFKNVPTVFIPVFWVEHKFTLTAELATKLRLAALAPSIGYTIAAVIFFSGIIIILVTLGYHKNYINGKDSDKKPTTTVKFVSKKSKDIS